MEVKKNSDSTATFIYDGDGNRVKSTINGVTTYFIGGHYEVTGSTVTKYYFAGSQRVAMRAGSTLSYLLSDHLGSTSITTNGNGILVSELRYKPWGETRYSNGTTLTKYQYTGQFSYQSDFGLLFYNSRFYDPALGRFAQADTIIPGGVQGWDHYAYVNNNPLRYTDPSGHRSCDDENDCENGIKAKVAGCSVLTGAFNGSFTCTPADLNRATIAQRRSWFNQMLASVDSTLPEQFNNINGILNAFVWTDEGAPGSWTSWGDAGILNSIQNGLAIFKGRDYDHSSTNPYSLAADSAWDEYFTSYHDHGPSNATLKAWGAAEALGTSYGRLLAAEHGATKTLGETLFLGVGDMYRTGMLNRNPGPIETDAVRGIYEWFFNTSSTIPGTDVSPVSIVASILLPIK